MSKFLIGLVVLLALVLGLALAGVAVPSWAAASTAIEGCSHPADGSVVQRPPDLLSADGALNVSLGCRQSLGADGRTRI